MNYKKHYTLLVNRARSRNLGCYVEKHHIVPKCMNGSDDFNNIVSLTAEEHFLAHQLLVKIFPDNVKLIYALHAMCIGSKNHIRNNKMYGWIRRESSKARTGQKRTQETKNKMSVSASGKIRTQEHRDNLSKSLKGHTPWNKGQKFSNRILSDEHKLSISMGLSGKEKSVEHVAKSVARRIENNSTGKGSKWYNNGTIHIRCQNSPPEGFVEGRIFRKRNRKGNNND